MSANSSVSCNGCLPSTSLSNIYSFLHKCIDSPAGKINMTAFTITSTVFLLPLSVLVFYLGLKRWRQQRPGTMMSHSDVCTYHMTVIELMNVLGSTLICLSVHTDLSEIKMVGMGFFSNNLLGQMFFHLLTCVERYLAVVHPVTYLSLRKAKWIRIRNFIIGSIWLLCFAGTGLLFVPDQAFTVSIGFCIIAFMFIVTSFCSLSVLYVLIRPGPGEGGRDRQHVDQSKVRAFYTILAILGVLVFRFGGNIVATSLCISSLLGDVGRCNVWMSTVWFPLPSSLVLPLLFLQRAGTLPCCKNNKPGQGPD